MRWKFAVRTKWQTLLLSRTTKCNAYTQLERLINPHHQQTFKNNIPNSKINLIILSNLFYLLIFSSSIYTKPTEATNSESKTRFFFFAFSLSPLKHHRIFHCHCRFIVRFSWTRLSEESIKLVAKLGVDHSVKFILVRIITSLFFFSFHLNYLNSLFIYSFTVCVVLSSFSGAHIVTSELVAIKKVCQCCVCITVSSCQCRVWWICL